MAWMQCRSCSAKFAVGLLRCPQCGAVSELYAAPEEVIEAEQEANMPKISVAGGPSNALGEVAEPDVLATESTETEAPAEPGTSDVTSAATDEATDPDEDAADKVESQAEAASEPAPAPKTARKIAAKKAAAKQESAPQG